MFHGTGASGEMGVRMLWQWPDMLRMVNLVRLYVGLKNKRDDHLAGVVLQAPK